MSSNFKQRGDTHDFISPTGGTVAGHPVKIGSIILVAKETTVAGALTSGDRVGMFTLKAEGAASGQAMAYGDLVYWDDTAKQVTKTVGSNTKIGVYASATAKASTDVLADVQLVPVV
jgi:predicted RecA/RadA family phage recombinase